MEKASGEIEQEQGSTTDSLLNAANSPSPANGDRTDSELKKGPPQKNASLGRPPLPTTTRQRSDASAKPPSVPSWSSQKRNADVTVNPADSRNIQVSLPFRPSTRSTNLAAIELSDGQGLVNPMEAEAETYIIRSIDNAPLDLQPPVLQNIPDDLIARTLSEDTAGSSVQNSQPSIIRLRRQRSTDSHNTSTSKGTANTTNRQQQQQPQARKHQTVEEQLFGLTGAMEAIHFEHQMAQGDASHTNGTSSLALSANGTDSAATASSSYDTFAQNAELMYQQGQGEVSQAATMRRRNRANSNMEQTNMPATISEVSENEDAVEEDIEVGTPNPVPNVGVGGESNATTTQPPVVDQKRGWSRVKSLLFDDWAFVNDAKNFIRPKRNMIQLFLQVTVLFTILPSIGIAAILFYCNGNPPTGRLINNGEAVNGTLINDNGNVVDPAATSISYYLLFAARQVITLIMAVGSQFFWIDFLAIDRGYLFKLGSRVPLFIMQAHGWPFILFFWSMYDWALISGKHPFFGHWLYFQDTIALFNMSNADGDLVNSTWNRRILGLATGLSLAVAVKRFWMAIFLGKQTYYQFSDKLAVSMKKMLLVSQIAMLSRQIETSHGRAYLRPREVTVSKALSQEKLGGLLDSAEDDLGDANVDDSVLNSEAAGTSSKERMVVDPNDRSPLTGKLSATQQSRIVRLLGAWEEPNVLTQSNDPISIKSIMHFRRAVNYLRTEFPFSASFGPAGTREDCIASAQEVFQRLMLKSARSDVLNFEVLAMLGAKSDDTLDQDKLMELIKLFRPDRDGSLSQVHFARSVDEVYKEIRLLQASVSNSSKVDAQFEVIVNIAFYAGVFVVALYILGIDPLSLFVSISGLVVGLSFMISSSSAQFFQGLLFILVRRPYAIGDYIHVSDPNTDTAASGSSNWIVEDISLVATTVRLVISNEKASLSNGALADSRIINASKSYNAAVFQYLKFPIDVPYEKLRTFHEALEAFVRNRPREWIGLGAFRAANVNASAGYTEYIICANHRECCANRGQIKASLADLLGFCVELSKKLDIVYRPPTKPIDLRLSAQQSRYISRELGSFQSQNMRQGGQTHDSVMNPPERMEQDFERESLLASDIQSLVDQFPPKRLMGT